MHSTFFTLRRRNLNNTLHEIVPGLPQKFTVDVRLRATPATQNEGM
jgi:hypothetical protein